MKKCIHILKVLIVGYSDNKIPFYGLLKVLIIQGCAVLDLPVAAGKFFNGSLKQPTLYSSEIMKIICSGDLTAGVALEFLEWMDDLGDLARDAMAMTDRLVIDASGRDYGYGTGGDGGSFTMKTKCCRPRGKAADHHQKESRSRAVRSGNGLIRISRSPF